jgi:hypothetical protein
LAILGALPATKRARCASLRGAGTCGGASGSRRILPPSGCRSPAVVDVARPCCRSKNLFTPVEKPSVGGAAKLAELWRPAGRCSTGRGGPPRDRACGGRPHSCRSYAAGAYPVGKTEQGLPGDVRPAGATQVSGLWRPGLDCGNGSPTGPGPLLAHEGPLTL